MNLKPVTIMYAGIIKNMVKSKASNQKGADHEGKPMSNGPREATSTIAANRLSISVG